MEKNVDMDERENSSDVESEESGAENMSDVSDKVITSNPRIMIGITGVRHIQRAAGLSVWPVFYMSKEQVGVIITKKKKYIFLRKKSNRKKKRVKLFFFLQYNDNNKCHNTKLIRMNFPLHKLDDITEGLLELCQGLDFPVNANVGSK